MVAHGPGSSCNHHLHSSHDFSTLSSRFSTQQSSLSLVGNVLIIQHFRTEPPTLSLTSSPPCFKFKLCKVLVEVERRTLRHPRSDAVSWRPCLPCVRSSSSPLSQSRVSQELKPLMISFNKERKSDRQAEHSRDQQLAVATALFTTISSGKNKRHYLNIAGRRNCIERH